MKLEPKYKRFRVIAEFILLICFFISTKTTAQYWQQEVNYKMQVSLNDSLHSIKGFAEIEYINNSPDTLHFIWFHIWPNAYKSDKTAFAQQSLKNGSTRFYFSKEEEKGYINQLDFKVNDVTALIEDHPEHLDIIKVKLPTPLFPKQSTKITTPFYVKLPFHFSRSGHVGQSYQIAQWYPKPAVYDSNGWNEMPYLDQGEFYSEYGSYDVKITVPKNYVVAATGNLQNKEEKDWLINNRSYTEVSTLLDKKGEVESIQETKTLQYHINNVHDFAWFADKRFVVDYSTTIKNNKPIDIFSYYIPSSQKTWTQANTILQKSLNFFTQEVGDYPYETLSAVEGPQGTGGGMEYPTITLISPTSSELELEQVIVHEVGHNWFYGILGSNERKHPWMDESVTSFYERKYFGTAANKYINLLDGAIEAKNQSLSDQPINLPADQYNAVNYLLSIYHKGAQWLQKVEQEMGTEAFRQAMKNYFEKWKFNHPQPENLLSELEKAAANSMANNFALLNKKGLLSEVKRKGTKLHILPNKLLNSYPTHQNLLTLFPFIGYNAYDGLMPGISISNLKLPLNRFRFLINSNYGLRSKNVTGIGFASYSLYPKEGLFHRVDIGVNASHFSINDYKDIFKNTTIATQTKIAPALKFTLKETDPHSTKHKYIRLKSFLLNEESLRFSLDSTITPTDTTYYAKAGTENKRTNLFQVKAVYEDNRALYPYRAELTIDQGKGFLRAGFTGNYFFNYSDNGGLKVRLFAGKYFKLTNNTPSFTQQRYHLNMTGANGNEDFTYSEYFIGRNKFEGLESQQIMERDGAFKVRTDLLNQKVGKTDDWLMALNFSSTLPNFLNPFQMLPFEMPIRIFADIGTYAEAWKANSHLDRFIFDAGLQIALYNENVNIYIPLVYSGIFKDYLQSTIPKKERFLKKISFTIDIANFGLRKIDRNLVLF